MTDPHPGRGPASNLAARAEKLQATVTDLVDAVDSLGTRQRRTNRIVIYTVTCMVLTLILVVVVGALYFGQRNTTEQLRATTERVQAQQRQITAAQGQVENTRRRVLCPLYVSFLSFQSPERRAELPPEQRPAYDQAFVVIRQGADTLRCARS